MHQFLREKRRSLPRAWIFTAVLAGVFVFGCGKDSKLVVKVSGPEGEPVAGVRLQQVGVPEPLGVTGVDGTAAVQPQRGNGAVALKLSMDDGSEPRYEFVNPYPVDQGHFNSRRRIIRVRLRETAADRAPARWEITSDPDSAEVFVDGLSVGRTPLRLEGLEPGSVDVELRKAGFASYRLSFLLKPGKNEGIHVPLRPAAGDAGLGDGAGATVAGGDTGATPETGGEAATTEEGNASEVAKQDPGAGGSPQVDAVKRTLRTALDLRDWPAAEAALDRYRALAPGDPEAALWERAIEDGRSRDAVRLRVSTLRASITRRMNDGDLTGARSEVEELQALLPGDALALEWMRELDARLESAAADAAAPVSSEKDRIGQLLDRYRQSLEALDVEAYAALWRAMDADTRKRIKAAFRDLKSQTVTLRDETIRIQEDGATVSFGEERVFRPRAGSSQRLERRVVMTLVRGGDGEWKIAKLETE